MLKRKFLKRKCKKPQQSVARNINPKKKGK
jgi:hypothetical protein